MPTVPVLDATGKAGRHARAVRRRLRRARRACRCCTRRWCASWPTGASAPTTPRAAARCRAAAGSRGSRRAPAARGRARSAPPSGRAAASRSARRRAATTRRCRGDAAGRAARGAWPRRSRRASCRWSSALDRRDGKTKTLVSRPRAARARRSSDAARGGRERERRRCERPPATCRGSRSRRPGHVSVYQLIRTSAWSCSSAPPCSACEEALAS